MDKKTLEESEARFTELIQQPPYPVEEMMGILADMPVTKVEENAPALFTALSEAQDFIGALGVLRIYGPAVEKKLRGVGVRDQLKKATRDRLLSSVVDSVGFGVRPFADSLARIDRLLYFSRPNALVLSTAWGLGEVKRLDGFYRRVVVDFRSRRGHQFTFDAACETLVPAPEDHILVKNKTNPEEIERQIKEEPGKFIKSVLQSYGDMTVVRLEDVCVQNGFVKSANWKAFWDRARADLRKDNCVEIPTRRAEPIHLKESAETYGESWFTAFMHITDPKSILSSVRELQGTGRIKELDAESCSKLAERLAFALKGARGVDDSLYARIAFCVDELKLDTKKDDGSPFGLVNKARAYLLENDRYLAAAKNLPARDTASLVKFVVAADGAVKLRLFEKLPEMCFSLLAETLTFFKDDVHPRDESGEPVPCDEVHCEDAVAALLTKPNAPATLVTFILGRWKTFSHWTLLPKLVVILTHAIALGEGRQSGETLRMQNVIRRLFADEKWLKEIFTLLADPSKPAPSADQSLVFDRFQASIAWDPSTHHVIVVRMTHCVPELAERVIKKEEVKKAERITSMRSYAERKAAYHKLVTVDIPKNARDIEFARGYGDLSENFEYQSAKDQERVLIQKQSVMQEELNAVKPVDFSDVATDQARPGTTVSVQTSSGETRRYTILGEWDNDLERGIISNKTRLAENLMGRKPGDAVEIMDAEGVVSTATLVAVESLSEELRAWVKEGASTI